MQGEPWLPGAQAPRRRPPLLLLQSEGLAEERMLRVPSCTSQPLHCTCEAAGNLKHYLYPKQALVGAEVTYTGAQLRTAASCVLCNIASPTYLAHPAALCGTHRRLLDNLTGDVDTDLQRATDACIARSAWLVAERAKRCHVGPVSALIGPRFQVQLREGGHVNGPWGHNRCVIHEAFIAAPASSSPHQFACDVSCVGASQHLPACMCNAARTQWPRRTR